MLFWSKLPGVLFSLFSYAENRGGDEMITISLCMIVKNEEEVLERCLDSIRDAVEEIVIVDTGSIDGTRDIAKKYTEKIYTYPWKEDFASARNYALEKGTMDYLMWMDADDAVSPKCKEALLGLKKILPPKIDMVMMPYVTGRDENGRPAFVYYRERLVKNHKGFRFIGRVHEVIPPRGNVYYAEEVFIEHKRIRKEYSRRNLEIYEDMEKGGEKFAPRELYYYGRELLSHGHYKKGAAILEEFLKHPQGWVENKIDATRQLAFCRYGLKEEEGALSALLKGLEYDVPRGETCCALGRHFMDRGKWRQAAYWYEQALAAKKDTRTGAFVSEDCYGYLPAISLCVCYDRMGERKLAEYYNELAGKFKPESCHYLLNKEYFKKLFRERLNKDGI